MTTVSRPAVWLGFSYFAALLLATFLGAGITPYLAAALFLALCAVLLLRMYRTHPAVLLMLLSATAGMVVFSVLSWLNVLPAERYIGNTYRIQATIESDGEHSYGRYYYKARLHCIEDTEQAVDFSIRLSHGEALRAEIGDEIACTAHFVAFEDGGGLSSRTSQLADGKLLAAYITDYESISIVPAKEKAPAWWCALIRNSVRDKLLSAYPKAEGSVLCAMLLGLRDDISDTATVAYRSAGASHILVISGMHMAIIAQFALSALCFFGIRRRYAAGLSILFVLGFMIISGMSVTVVRSGIMQILLLLGLITGRTADPLNSLAVAVLFLTVSNPFCVGDVSLLLSFFATLGIIQLSPRMMKALTAKITSDRRKEHAVRLLSPLVMSVSAILAMLPIQLYVFGTINFSSVLTSLLVLYASSWLIRFGLLAAICLSVPFPAPAAAPFVFLSGLLAKYQNAAVDFVAAYFPGTLEISGPYLPATVLICVFFLLLAFWIGRKRIPFIACGLAACILFTGMFANAWINGNQTRLLILDTPFAQCTARIDASRASILQCSGDGSTAREALLDYGVETIELLHVQSSESAVRCAQDLADAFPVSAVLAPDTVYFPVKENVRCEFYTYGYTGGFADGSSFSISSGGGLIAFSVCGESVLLESRGGGYVAESADILITESGDTLLSAPFTVLRTDMTLQEAAQVLPSGQCILTSEHERICLRFEPDGSYAILGA